FDKQLAKDQLIADKGLFELNLRLLKGEEVETKNKIRIPDPSPEIRPLLTKIDDEWYNSYEKSIQTIFVEDIIIGIDSLSNRPLINPKVEEAAQLIFRDNKMMLAQHNELIRLYQSVFQKQIDRANQWLLVLWIVNVIFILLGLFLILDWLFKPLQQISRVAQSIGEGDLRKKIDYNYKNEVGIVATAINGMIDKIQNATNFIKSIEKGDLSVSYHGLNGSSLERDTLAGALINMREKMKAVALDEEERTWTTKGLAMFGEILQKYNDDTERLSYEIISNVVRYQDANQGGLFILKDEDETPKRLELIASYAFNRRKYIQKEVVEGEGLVGQSFKDADTIYITDIPENYVDITSGLGGTRPKSVLVVPLKMSDQVYGVIELASFDEFKPYEIAFLEKLSENIASNLYAARANERTKKLLVESNHITSQMKQQEQEMRNNLRMLEETQIEMQKNQEALAAQSYAIKSTLITVELGMDRSILSANELFLKATNYKASELIGKGHELLVPDNQIDQSYYDRLWRDLRVGIPHSGEYKRLSKDGKEIWLKATYSPITNKDGIPYKILKLAFDVTEDKRLRLDFKEQLDSFKRSSAVVEFDLEGKIIDVNDNFLDLMEYDREEIIGQDHMIIIPDDEKKSKSYRALWHKLRQGTYHIGEVKRVTKSGKTVWFQGSFNPILDLNGKPYKIIEFIIDITARKSAETRILATKEELQFKEANLTALLNNTDDVIYTIGPNYRITLMNDSARRFFEKMGESLRISSNVLDIIPRNYYYIWKGYYDRALGGEKFSVEQAIFSEKTNHKFYLSIFFNPILDEFGKISGVAIFSRNVTKRKQRELDISEFTKKQASRTARIIENQKQALQRATEDFEKERQQMKEELAQEKSEKLNLEKDLNYYLQLDAPMIVFNHDYELLRMNTEAQELFRQWHIYLQPGYFI
ncbi:MAG: PAS domain S-box protein, partial [Bacteroidota bacterium]